MSYNTVDQSTGALKQAAGSTVTAIYADAPVGAIVPYGGDTAPTGYLLCDGSAVSRTTYSDLYGVIGTKYGSGDGSTTFNLPDGEAGAELYPAADVGSGIAGSVYIIKAVKTALPTDFEAAIDGIDNQLTANNSTAGVTDVPFRFGCDDNGKFGYILTEGGADTVIPFKSGGESPIYDVYTSDEIDNTFLTEKETSKILIFFNYSGYNFADYHILRINGVNVTNQVSNQYKKVGSQTGGYGLSFYYYESPEVLPVGTEIFFHKGGTSSAAGVVLVY